MSEKTLMLGGTGGRRRRRRQTILPLRAVHLRLSRFCDCFFSWHLTGKADQVTVSRYPVETCGQEDGTPHSAWTTAFPIYMNHLLLSLRSLPGAGWQRALEKTQQGMGLRTPGLGPGHSSHLLPPRRKGPPLPRACLPTRRGLSRCWLTGQELALGQGPPLATCRSVWTVSLPTGHGFHSSRLWWRWVGGAGVEMKGLGSQRGVGGRGLPHRRRVLPLFWKLLLNWDAHPHPSSSPPTVCLMRKPFWPSQLKVLALRLITAKPRTKEVKAGSLGLPSTWQLPLGVCVSEARPLNRAVFSVLVKQSRAASLPGLSPPFSSFLRD